MNLKQFNTKSMISMLSLFAITGSSNITSIAKQNVNKDEAARRMGSYIQGCKDCQCRGFPKGKYQIDLKITGYNRKLENVVFDHQTGTITGYLFDYPIQNGFHDCEHAYFEVVGRLVCNAWGTGYPKIDEMIATCTYYRSGWKIAEFTAKFIPM